MKVFTTIYGLFQGIGCIINLRWGGIRWNKVQEVQKVWFKLGDSIFLSKCFLSKQFLQNTPGFHFFLCLFLFYFRVSRYQRNFLGFIGSYLSIKYAAKRSSNILMSSFLRLRKLTQAEKQRISLYSSLNIQNAIPKVFHKNDQMGERRRPRVEKELLNSIVRITIR